MMLFDFFINRPFKSILSHDHAEEPSAESDLHVSRQIEKVSELLAFVAVYDPETLIELHAWFEEISQIANDSSESRVATMAIAAGKISEELILRNSSERILDETFRADRVKQTEAHIQHRLAEILTDMGVKVNADPRRPSNLSPAETQKSFASLG